MAIAIPPGRLAAPDDRAAETARNELRALQVDLGPVWLAAPEVTLKNELLRSLPAVTTNRLAVEEESPVRDAGHSINFGVEAPQYLKSSEVTRPARPETELPPLPSSAGSGSGRLVLALWIDEAGVVTHFEVEMSHLPAELEQAVIDQIVRVRFRPAEKDGLPVKNKQRIELLIKPAAASEAQVN